MNNCDNTPLRVLEHINFERITSIKTRNVVSEQKLDTLCYNHLDNAQRLQELQKNLDLKHVEPKVREQIKKILLQYHEVFTLKRDPLPCTSLTEHEIVLKTRKIINLRSHKLSEAHREFVLDHTKELLEKGIIRHSQSHLSGSSLKWVNKLRMVLDYRQVNEDTDQDAYPLLVIDDILDHLGQGKLFSAFDLSSCFHQIPIAENSIKYTAFSTPDRHFEFT